MGYIQLKTKVPGPRSRILLSKRKEAVARGPFNAVPIFVKSARGALLTDVDGNRFIDLAGGIGSLNVGHCPQDVVEALKEQLDSFIHPVFHVTMYESYVHLAHKLNQIVPGTFPKKTVFFNSGSEAVENAVKIARRYTKRKAIISFERGFHGRTLLSMSLTGKVKSFKRGFGPMATDIYKLPYPYPYRQKQTGRELLDHFDRLFEYHVSPEDVAAIILEPVQGDGGIIVPTEEFVSGVKRICDRFGILLIADEVQTGFGRTGKWFGMEHFGVVPDLTVMSKSLAAGIPLSAVTGRAEIMEAPDKKEIGGTLAGSPLGCVAGLKVINKIERENLLERAKTIGELIRTQLAFDSKYIGEVRGLGAMVGIEIVKDQVTKEPYPEFVAQVVKECYRQGVILITAGSNANVIRLLPPLVIKDDQLMEALTVLKRVIKKLESETLRS